VAVVELDSFSKISPCGLLICSCVCVYVCVRVCDRLDKLHRLADKVQRDCRTCEDHLDDIEQRLQQVTLSL